MFVTSTDEFSINGKQKKGALGGKEHCQEHCIVILPWEQAAIPVVEGRWSTAAGSGTIADCLRQGRRHPGLVCMCDRKPRYDVAVSGH